MSEAHPTLPGPSRRLPRFLAGSLALAAALACLRNPMFAWQPALAAVLLCFRPRVSVLALAGATSVLLLLGGTVTTYRVGMAVPDWPQTMGQGMFSYPLDEMLESGLGVTLEHSHRLWATLVGLISILVVLTMWLHRVRRATVLLAVVSLLLVIVQGVLGGTRVIDNRQELAFVHGAFAQLYYATVIALVVVSGASWQSAARGVRTGSARLAPLADLGTGLVYVQVVLGAWLRHSGRSLPLVLHLSFALVVVGALMLLAKRLRLAREQFDGPPRSAALLQRLRRALLWLLSLQLALGLSSWLAITYLSEGFQGRVSVAEAVFATLHVGVGAMLLGCVVACAMWSRRLYGASREAPARPSGTVAAVLEG